MTIYRYSRWDGTQQIFEMDEDDIMESLSDDILAHGDVNRALRNMFQRGTRDEQGRPPSPAGFPPSTRTCPPCAVTAF